MEQPTPKNWSRLQFSALILVVAINVVSSWYPFVVDLPQRIINTARQQQDGSWDVDGSSRVTGHAPTRVAAAMANNPFRLTIEAWPASPGLTGPARLLAVGHSPYDASFMLGIERNEVVLRLPCSGAEAGTDVEWRMPIQNWQKVVVSVWFDFVSGVLVPSIQVNAGRKVQLQNDCPAGTVPTLPSAAVPWTLGNVGSGHRPFVGRIVKLELTWAGHQLDLLGGVRWQTPAMFWVWPERVYQPAGDHPLAATWHFVGYVPLGYLVGTAIPHLGCARVLAGALAFPVALNGGKLFVAGRHASLVDLVVNLAGLLAGFFAYQRHHARSISGVK